nr:MAG TPA: hypothetical protein [Caudoviricetes sp.]
MCKSISISLFKVFKYLFSFISSYIAINPICSVQVVNLNPDN